MTFTRYPANLELSDAPNHTYPVHQSNTQITSSDNTSDRTIRLCVHGILKMSFPWLRSHGEVKISPKREGVKTVAGQFQVVGRLALTSSHVANTPTDKPDRSGMSVNVIVSESLLLLDN